MCTIHFILCFLVGLLSNICGENFSFVTEVRDVEVCEENKCSCVARVLRRLSAVEGDVKRIRVFFFSRI
jgi:hypothetical protein